MITIGTHHDGSTIIRNLDDGSALTLTGGLEEFQAFAEMVVDELNAMDSETDYVLEEFDVEDDGDDTAEAVDEIDEDDDGETEEVRR